MVGDENLRDYQQKPLENGGFYRHRITGDVYQALEQRGSIHLFTPSGEFGAVPSLAAHFIKIDDQQVREHAAGLRDRAEWYEKALEATE